MNSNFEDDYFYHYERELREIELASNGAGEADARHRDLADLHRARRQHIRFIETLATASARRPAGIDRTDKEC